MNHKIKALTIKKVKEELKKPKKTLSYHRGKSRIKKL